jgi:transposase
VETLSASGVTALYRRIAAPAAQRRGLRPASAHLAPTSFPVDGRDKSAEAPEAQGVPITKGSSREHRPDRNQVMREVIIAHQAGIPGLRKPLSGTSRDAQEFGRVIRPHIAPWRTTSAATSLVAERARYSAANLAALAQTAMTWSPRVPAPVSAAHTVRGAAKPQAMAPLAEG